jgi:hypothetical protein
MPVRRRRFHLVAGTLAALLLAPSCREAKDDARKALRPEDAARLVALENRGIALLERYDYLAAAEALREAHDLAPAWIPGRVHLALALLHSGPDKRPEARALLAGVLRDDPAQPHAAFLSAWLAENAGESEAALELYRTAYRLTGEDPVVGAKLGTLLGSLDGHQEEALALLKKVHERRPALISPVNQLMLLHRQLGKDDEAQAYLQKLYALKGRLRADMEQPKAGEELRDAYGNMGRYSMALRDFGDPGTAAKAAEGPVTAKVEDVPGWAPGALPDGVPYLGAAALDFDQDGDVDLFVCGGTKPSALLRNDGGKLTDVATEAGVAVLGAYAVAAGEVDVDPSKTPGGEPGRRARVDLVVLRKDGLALLRNEGGGKFADVTRLSGLHADPGGARAALLFDAEHDGDLDLFLSGEGGQTNRLWANKGPGVFEEKAAEAGLAGDGGPYGPAVMLDFDEDLDVDLVVSRPSAPPAIYVNDRLLKFRAVEAPKGVLPAPHGIVAADFDRDGHEDVLLQGDVAALLSGDGKRLSASAHATGSATAGGGVAVVIDPLGSGEPAVLTASGGWLHREALHDPLGRTAQLFDGTGLANVLAVDLDGDGAEELLRILPAAPLQRVVLSSRGRGAAVVLDLEGVIRNDVQAGWSNLEGRGALVEVKAGALWQQRRVGNPSGYGCSSPTRLVCGVGARPQADFVRVLWPDAVQQAVLDVPSGVPQAIVEEQRRPDSCPLLFSWDGERWVFVTDFLGAGGVGFLIAPGVYAPPDPTESVKVDASLVVPRDGKVVFKLLESMEEVCYVDHCDLQVVDHPADVTVFPDERFAGERPFPDGRLLAYRREILPVAARDGRGADVLDRVVAIDRRYPDSFRLHPRLAGATEDAVLDLDFGDRLDGVAPGDGVVLYAHGWIEYGYTRTSVAAAGEGFEAKLPTLEAWDAAASAWKVVVPNVGYPAGFPRVMTYDLTGVVSRATPRLRIRTNFEVYWDKVWLAPKVDVAQTVRETILPVASADLRWVGYPREFSPDGRVPRIYDYGTMDPSMPWKTVVGDFTKFGDVTPLLGGADDMYVVQGKGEEIEVRFDASRLPPLPDGWSRSYVLRTTGWCKGQEMYVAHGSTVEPLPFLGMSHYPYPATERYPDDEAHRAYRRTWNTRRIGATR